MAHAANPGATLILAHLQEQTRSRRPGSLRSLFVPHPTATEASPSACAAVSSLRLRYLHVLIGQAMSMPPTSSSIGPSPDALLFSVPCTSGRHQCDVHTSAHCDALYSRNIFDCRARVAPPHAGKLACTPHDGGSQRLCFRFRALKSPPSIKSGPDPRVLACTPSK